MSPEAPTTPQPDTPDPTKDRPSPAMPEGISYLLQLVRILLFHGRRLGDTVTTQAANPRFVTIAAAFGTYDLPLILARIQRGLLRLAALENHLLRRAEKCRDIAETAPRTRSATPPEPKENPPTSHQADAAPRPRRTPYNPDSAHIPSLAEIEAEIRRRPVGRTIAYICMDLAVIPGFCTSPVWNALLDTLQSFGGSLGRLYQVRFRREKAYQREREKRPETWAFDWRDLRAPTVRQIFGALIGESPADHPPDPGLIQSHA